MKYFVALLACAGVLLFWSVIGATVFNWQHGGGFLWQIFIWCTVIAVWAAVTRAWRGKAAHAESAAHRVPPAQDEADDPGRSGSGDAATESAIEEEAYEQALSEVEGGTAKKGLWAKALEMEPSDENRRKAKYIGLRVRQILKETPITIDDWSYDDGWFIFKCPECRRKQEIEASKGTQKVSCADCGQQVKLSRAK